MGVCTTKSKQEVVPLAAHTAAPSKARVIIMTKLLEMRRLEETPKLDIHTSKMYQKRVQSKQQQQAYTASMSESMTSGGLKSEEDAV